MRLIYKNNIYNILMIWHLLIRMFYFTIFIYINKPYLYLIIFISIIKISKKIFFSLFSLIYTINLLMYRISISFYFVLFFA